MSTLRVMFSELRYRKLNFLLSALAVTIAVMLFVTGPVLIDGYGRETQARLAELEAKTGEELARMEDQTRRLMRDMGFNLMIVHRDTNMSDFWADDFAAADMPQEYVDRLAADRRLTLVRHIVATLQGRITWEDRKVLVVGYSPEATQAHLAEKSPMGYRVEPGTVFLGHELGVGRKPGEKITLAEREFRIERILPEQGSKEDISIVMHLDDAQAVLNRPGRVNQIMALGCNCAGSDLPNIRRQLAAILPDTRITEFRSIALARAEQRELVAEKHRQILAETAHSREQVQGTIETLAAVTTPVVVLASAIWVGLLALANVRERRTEIGLLRALGKGSSTIAGLLLGKAALVGLSGAAVGVLLGIGAAWLLGVEALDVAAERFAVPWTVMAYALVGAPLLSAVASYLPTVVALVQDPAIVLRDH